MPLYSSAVDNMVFGALASVLVLFMFLALSTDRIIVRDMSDFELADSGTARLKGI